jgi:ABC-type transporter MlaC component
MSRGAGIRAIAFVAVLAKAIGPATAVTDDPAAEAKAALSPVLVEIVAMARGENASAEEKRALIEHELAIWLDYGYMAKLALGARAEMFSSDQRAEFLQEFERYLSDVYIRRIARFRETEIEIKQASLNAETGVVTIRTLGGVPIDNAYLGLVTRRMWKDRADVDYLLRHQRGEWRIISIRIDGVDLARNFGDQFQAVLQRSDPGALIAELCKRNAEREAQNPFD